MTTVIEYPKVAALQKVHECFLAHDGNVFVQEKVDGSNVAVRIIDGELVLQSRTTIIDQNNPGMFRPFVEWAQQHFLTAGRLELARFNAVLYGEMVGNGKIKYLKSTPPFLLFDIRVEPHEQAPRFLDPSMLAQWATHFRLTLLPYLYIGPYKDLVGDDSTKLATKWPSNFTDTNMEGVVIKSTNVTCWYTRAADNEIVKYTEPLLAGKVVREDYKETRAPKRALDQVIDPLAAIAESLVTEARLQKAIQRAQEEGKYDPLRPHVLIPYVARDVHDEDMQLVHELLERAYWKPLNGAIAKRVVELANT